MQERMVKFYSRESNLVAIHAIPGHFATSHSHINYYIDITSLKTRVREAKEIARVLYHKIGRLSYTDTIVCMDGTEVIGAFLAEEFEKCRKILLALGDENRQHLILEMMRMVIIGHL